jgi:hypothetical protein
MKDALMPRIFLTVVGLLYLALATWCTLAPRQTSQKVGFDLHPGSGQSEFLVIYGGLELALALLFLAPLVRPNTLSHSLWACLIVHGCLALFRAASFLLYRDIPATTVRLSIAEWVIFLVSAWLVWRLR